MPGRLLSRAPSGGQGERPGPGRAQGKRGSGPALLLPRFYAGGCLERDRAYGKHDDPCAHRGRGPRRPLRLYDQESVWHLLSGRGEPSCCAGPGGPSRLYLTDGLRIRPRTSPYTVGSTSSVSSVDDTIPPITTVARGR